MARYSVLLAVICLFWLFGGAVAVDPPKPGATTPFEQPKRVALESLLQDKERNVNGVIFRIQAHCQLQDKVNFIQIQWSLDYDGPRWPFTILAPTLLHKTAGQTQLRVFATGKDRETYAFEKSSPTDELVPLPRSRTQSKKDWFVTKRTANDKKLEGRMSFPVGEVKQYLVKVVPDQFDSDRSPRMYVQVYHVPMDRGGQYSLDAWTGMLYSTTVEVKLPKW